MIKVEVIPVYEIDQNYAFVAYDSETLEAIAIDPTIFKPVDDFISQKKLNLTAVLNTHHHFDHVGGNKELKEKYNCTVYGPSYDQERIPEIDHAVSEGDKLEFLGQKAEVLFTPGHTKGHIVYHFKNIRSAFVGDCLFAMGCGRLFEGTPEQMFDSLQKIKKLHPQTQIYCAHEYTQKNAQFALSVLPDVNAIKIRAELTDILRASDLKTIPFILIDDLKSNPFLLAETSEQLGHYRELRDNF